MSVVARETRKDIPLRPVKLGAPTAVVDRKPDGTIHLRVAEPLAEHPPTYNHSLEYWAQKTPDTVFLAQRGPDGEWRKLTYAQVLARVKRIAAGLLTRNLSAERPIAILSGNGIEHALLALAAMHVGIPYSAISPAYSLMSNDFGKLKYITELLTPGLVYAADGAMFGKAIDAAVPQNCELVVGQNPPPRGATPFGELDADNEPAVDAAHAKVKRDGIAKILFTSGSTGTPKAVINTHGMLTANQAMIGAGFAFLRDEPPVVIDWLPWSHTFGANHNFGLIITNGGTLFIDDGNPTPPGVPKTVRNLRDVAPTIYFNVPKGYEALVPHLRADKALRDNFFSRLKVLFYAGASLNEQTRQELEELAIETTGERIIFLTSLGSTETAPLALACTWDFPASGNIGLPCTGVELKLVPNEGKLEARLKGPHITPGYWRQEQHNKDSFDDEGYYKLGDALKFADPSDPGRGLLFDGRLAEDFKLSTGTWVSCGPLRLAFLDHFAPLVRDVVIAGADRDDIAVLVFPDVEACRKLCPDLPADTPPAALLADARVRGEFAKRMASLAKQSPGSSTRVCRALLLEAPPSLDVGEATDKGSINQRAVLKNRAALVEELYTAPHSARVIAF